MRGFIGRKRFSSSPDFRKVIKINKMKYHSYCCQNCGELIGWIGRFFQVIGFKFIHKCNGIKIEND